MDADPILNEFAGARLTQWLGCQHEVIDRHDLASNARLKFAQVTIAAEHDECRLNLSMRRCYRGRVAPCITGDTGVFENADPGLACRGGESKRVVQWMQGHGLRVIQTVVKIVGCDHAAHLFTA